LSVLNSSAVLNQIIPMQPRGWRDPRHFDNLVWELPIPEFDRRETLHQELADAAAEAERVAAIAPLREGAHFMRQRRAIRDALAGARDRIGNRYARHQTLGSVGGPDSPVGRSPKKSRNEMVGVTSEVITVS
jgi:hypothetical protein